MDFENERYVRVYIRDTADLLAIGWEGRLVLYELLRKVDRAGVIELDEGVLPEMLRVPREVFAAGWPRILEREIAEAVTNRDGKTYAVILNFIEAQEAKQSDRLRQHESRARRRDLARRGELGVTKRDGAVTNPVQESQPVTTGHTQSQPVTPSLAVPSLAVLDPPLPPNGGSARKRRKGKPGADAREGNPEWVSLANEVLDALNDARQKIAARFKIDGVKVFRHAKTNRVEILRAIDQDQATRDELLGAVRARAIECWQNEGRDLGWLDPITPFRAKNWPRSLAKIGTVKPTRANGNPLTPMITDPAEAAAYARKHGQCPPGWVYDCDSKVVPA